MSGPLKGVKPAISYTITEAALATGLSETVINDAIKAGVLGKVYPQKTLDGDTLSKPVIPFEVLRDWINGSPVERA